MGITYNVYCDESCHLENDRQPIMLLGALWCEPHHAHALAAGMREVKQRHGLAPDFEAKWTKVSPAQLTFYRDVLDLFFENEALHFRCLVAPKAGLRHEDFQQDHDTWYYKMFFTLLKNFLRAEHHYRVYLDIKDTRSAAKMRELHRVLCSNLYDADCSIVTRVQTVRSHEVAALQLADLLIGAVGYANRPAGTSAAKAALVEHVRRRSGASLRTSTWPGEVRFNLFHWRAQGARS